MKIHLSLVLTASLLLSTSAISKNYQIPEEFAGQDNKSPYTISYDDYTELLKGFVLYNSKSSRKKAPDSVASIGTRLKPKISRLTALEANRFDYEEYSRHAELVEKLTVIRKSLEAVPDELPLKYLSEKEQLAYWLNLHNIRVVEFLVNAYPRLDLEDDINEEDGFFNRPSLKVAGRDMSLYDVQKLVQIKFNKPVAMYGFYHGNIGSPDLPRLAYTGDNVNAMLDKNAESFINSNRGTYAKKDDELLVSTYYNRQKAYFPNFQQDLEAHLAGYLDSVSNEYAALQSSDKLKAKIKNWKITDLSGGMRKFGGSISTNSAALLDAFRTKPNADVNESSDTAGITSTSSTLTSYSRSFGRFTADQIEQMRAIRANIVEVNTEVKITDIEEEEQKVDDSKD